MDKDMITTISAFNKDYFKIGEAVRITDYEGKSFDGLITSVSNDCIQTVIIKYDSPMCGSPGYKTNIYNIWIEDIIENKQKIKKIDMIIKT